MESLRISQSGVCKDMGVACVQQCRVGGSDAASTRWWGTGRTGRRSLAPAKLFSGNISHLWKETCPLETCGSIVESDDGDVMDKNNTENKAARLGVKWSHYPDYSPWENLDSFFCSFYKQAIKNVEKAAALLRCLKWSVLKWDALDHDESFLYPAVVKMTSAANSSLMSCCIIECQGQTISLNKGLVKTRCTEFLCLIISLKVEKCIQMYLHIRFSVIDGCNQAF